MTPLHLASGKDKADVVNVLISHGGYIHTVDVVNRCIVYMFIMIAY